MKVPNVPPLNARPHAAVRATAIRSLALKAILQVFLIDWLKPPVQITCDLELVA